MKGGAPTFIIYQRSLVKGHIIFSVFSDPVGRLLPASKHSPAHTGGQRRVHGASDCHEAAQLFSQPEAAGAHPRGAHHSQFPLQNALPNIQVMSRNLWSLLPKSQTEGGETDKGGTS